MADKFLKTLKLPGIDEPYKIPQSAADVGAAPAGYGLGEAELISMAYIDSITYPGWYYSNESATLGGYTSNRWWMQVLAYGSGTTFATQRIITFNNGVGYELIRHKINGTWGEWEWENPPMDVDTEYRTTERYHGKPVYAKCISVGVLPSNAETTTSHGISNSKNFVAVWGHSGRYYFPTQWNDDSIGTINIYATSTRVYVRTTVAWDNYPAYVTIKYTKTTD